MPGDKENLVIVEDDEGVLDLIGSVTNLNLPEYETHQFHSPETLLASPDLAPNDISVAVLDIMFPGRMDGFDLLGKLREGNKDIAAVIVTGYDSPENQAKAEQMGAEYIPKPFRIEDLVGGINRASETIKRQKFLPSLIHDINNPLTPLSGNCQLLEMRYSFIKDYNSFNQFNNRINQISGIIRLWNQSLTDVESAVAQYEELFQGEELPDKGNPVAVSLSFIRKAQTLALEAKEWVGSLHRDAETNRTTMDPKAYDQIISDCQSSIPELQTLSQYLRVAEAFYTEGYDTVARLYAPLTAIKSQGDNAIVHIEPPEGASKIYTVCIVDDQRRQRELASGILGGKVFAPDSVGYALHAYPSGEKFVDGFRELEQIDLLWTDREMLEMDGFAVLQGVKGNPTIDKMVMVSGGAGPDHVQRALDLGASFIHKPYDAARLHDIVQEILVSPTPKEYKTQQ